MELMIITPFQMELLPQQDNLPQSSKEMFKVGKWNIYDGGKSNIRTAKYRYSKKKGFTYHSYMLIYGDRGEFTLLEALIKDFIEVIPREYI